MHTTKVINIFFAYLYIQYPRMSPQCKKKMQCKQIQQPEVKNLHSCSCYPVWH